MRDNPSNFDMIITLLRNEGQNMNVASFISSVGQRRRAARP